MVKAKFCPCHEYAFLYNFISRKKGTTYICSVMKMHILKFRIGYFPGLWLPRGNCNFHLENFNIRFMCIKNGCKKLSHFEFDVPLCIFHTTLKLKLWKILHTINPLLRHNTVLTSRCYSHLQFPGALFSIFPKSNPKPKI